IGAPDWWWRANAESTEGSQHHSSSICDGASTKSHSVRTPEMPAQRVRPPRRWCRRCPNSWKNVTTSPCSSNAPGRSEEHTSELQSHLNLVCRLLLEKT